MTEGLLPRHDKPMCVRIWLEVGHACEPRRSALGRALALDWRLWVRGVSGHDISAFVHKVVFYLHPASAFVYPKRVLQEPPYEIQESGSVSIEIPIHVYLKHSNKPKKIRLIYSLDIENNTQNSSVSRRIYYDLENPPEQLWMALMKGGGEEVARADATGCATKVIVLSASGDDRARTKTKPSKYKFGEPVNCKHISRKTTKPYLLEEICSKCNDTICVASLKKQLRSEMTEDDVNRASEIYLAYSNYEKSANALPMPPYSDPIYRIPELPSSLREALKTVEIDFMIQ